MRGSDFTYQLRIVKFQAFIMIEDLDKGGMSVTNNIENVVEIICRQEGLNPVDYHIIYRDSEGLWDGFDFATKQFVLIRENHWLKASIMKIKLSL